MSRGALCTTLLEFDLGASWCAGVIELLKSQSQSRQPCPMENQYHETEKTVSVAKKQYHSNFGKARLCKELHKTFVRTSLPEELTRSL